LLIAFFISDTLLLNLLFFIIFVNYSKQFLSPPHSTRTIHIL
jgi:hypothetical protein